MDSFISIQFNSIQFANSDPAKSSGEYTFLISLPPLNISLMQDVFHFKDIKRLYLIPFNFGCFHWFDIILGIPNSPIC